MSDATYMSVVIAAVIVVAGPLGWLLNNRFGRQSLEGMKQRADELIRAARRESEKAKRKSLLDVKEEILAQRTKAERDLRSRNGTLSKRERDLNSFRQKLTDEENNLKQYEEKLQETQGQHAEKEKELLLRKEESERLIEEQNELLQSISGMSGDDARRQLLGNLQAQTRLEAASMIKDIKDAAKKQASHEATRIIAMAVERASSEFSSERTTSLFDLPEGSDLKGRLIGQEGKNIRAFETATGIQMLIDDEARTVTLSGYNPFKREIARRVLQTLVKDGNVHPRRIEDLTRRKRKKLEEEAFKAGQEVLKELQIKGVHPEIIKLLGRLKFRTSYGQNVLQHVKEVAYLTGMLAVELRLDEKMARRAGLFHDIGKAIDYEREGTHPEIGAEVCEKYGENEIVVNSAASHHEDIDVTSSIAVLVSAADSLSGARPGARRKSIAEYIKRIEKLEELASSMKGVEQSYAIQAGREIRVIARSKEVDDARVDLLASDLASRIETEMDYPGKIKITVIREMRAVEQAH
jgi:ribonuclease Y